MRVLGIETSCDETGIGLLDCQQGIIGQALFSQIDLHRVYGGVVPELAARDHIRKLLPLIKEALGRHSLADVDALAYTAGPGLIGALLSGAMFAHSIAWAQNKPAIGIHHLEAHLLSPLLDYPNLRPPFIALLVSGGHTQLIEVQAIGRYQLLGESQDDAVGEAFDKLAKCLGLGYPGGPAIEQLAQTGRASDIQLPRPMTKKPNLDFSFSGIKTHVARLIEREGLANMSAQRRADIAYAFQEAIGDTLLIKLRRAVTATGLNKIVVAGGVSANLRLRHYLNQLKDEQVDIYYPRPELCTDNGVMIAFAGCVKLQAGGPANRPSSQPSGQLTSSAPQVHARWPLSQL